MLAVFAAIDGAVFSAAAPLEALWKRFLVFFAVNGAPLGIPESPGSMIIVAFQLAFVTWISSVPTLRMHSRGDTYLRATRSSLHRCPERHIPDRSDHT